MFDTSARIWAGVDWLAPVFEPAVVGGRGIADVALEVFDVGVGVVGRKHPLGETVGVGEAVPNPLGDEFALVRAENGVAVDAEVFLYGLVHPDDGERLVEDERPDGGGVQHVREE